MFKFKTFILFFFLILYIPNSHSQPLSGSYTIGIGGDYSTLSAAVSDLTTKGVSASVVFNIISGSYNEQIVIGSINGASAANTITFQSQTGNAADVTLTFTPTSTNNYVVRLLQADFITFQNITITASGSTSYGTLIKLDGDANNNRILNNILNGVSTTSSSTNLIIVYADGDSIDNIKISDNTFNNGSYGVYLSGISTNLQSSGTQITNNTFNNTGYNPILLQYHSGPQINGNTITSSTAQRGIEIQNNTGAIQILKNKISINGFYGIYLTNCDGGTGLPTPRGLIANNFITVGGTSTAYGIQIYSSTNQDVYHNSVNITGTNATAGRGLSVEGSGSSINIVNNIFANQGGGYAYYIGTTAAIGTSNYNNLYTVGNYVAYWTSDRTTLAALQTASGKDANSVSVYPHFVSNTDLHTVTPWLNGQGTTLASVSDDIDGTVRSSPPDIGADEFTPDPATTTPLSGSYTVGSGGIYASLSAVKADLLLKGISAPVTFNILNGTYIEQVELLPIPGSSSTNTVTFQSQSGNPANTTLFYAASGAGDNYVIRFNGADYIRIQNLTLASNNVVNATYAEVIDIVGGVEDLRIQNNILSGTQTSSGSTNQIIIGANNSLCTSRIISGNTFVNGSYGINMSGLSNTVQSSGTQITNNTFNNTGYNPILLQYHSGPQINGNTITSSTAQRGIEIQNNTGAIQILKNKISINGFYGIYLTNCDGGTGLPTPRGLIANNFITVGGTSTAYGIQIYSSTNQDIYHNSVNITGTHATAGRGLSVEGSGSSINIVNNIFANQGGGYAYYIGTTAAIGTSNYNNLYTSGTTLAFWSGNRANLQELKAISGKDANSVSLNPLFASNIDLHIGTLGLDSAATPLASVTDDIDAEPRDPLYPDIGADEFRIIIIPISLGVEYQDTVKAFGVRYYRLNTTAGKTLSVKTQATTLLRPPDAFTSTSRNLDRNTYQFRSEKIGFSTNEIIIPNTIDGAYYFYVYNPEGSINPYKFRADSMSFSVQRVRENTAGNNGEITLEIIGARFEENSTAILRRNGSSDVIAQQTNFINEARLNAVFVLNNVAIGQWDVVVRRPNATQAVLTNALTIQPTSPLDIQISMSGPAAIRQRQPGYYSLNVHNPMNINIERALVYLKVAGNVSLVVKPEALPMDIPPLPDVNVYFDSSTNTHSFAISLFNIGAGRTKTIPMTITFNRGGRFHFYADAFITTRSSFDSVYYISIKTALDSGWLDTSKVLANTFWNFPNGITQGCPYEDAGACEAWNLRNQQQDMARDAQGLVQDAATMLYFPFKKPGPSKLFSFGNFFRKLLDFHNKHSQNNQNLSSPEGVASFDPNDIVGPAANGALNWIQHKSLSYLIQFENDPDSATAPAQAVKIIQKLDANADHSSFTLGSFGFGSFIFNVPPGRDFYSARLDVRDSLNLYVDFTAGIYGDSIVWEFQSIDPLTNLPPTDPFSGFLLLNDSLHRGEGFVTYSVLPKTDITTGSRIYSQARIYFDDNPPILTRNIFRTIDVGKPTSSVKALNSTSPNSFNVSWGGADDAAIYQYTIYVSENSAPFKAWLTNTSDTTAIFTGEHGKTYGFFSIAMDTAGNVEQAKLTAETFTTVLSAPDEASVPYQFNLSQNYPNPFNPITNIKYTIPEASNVKLTIYDILGREVAVLVDEFQTTGNKQLAWDASNYPSGIYFYRLVAISTSKSKNKYTAVKKLLLIK
ncbi:MAG: 5'-Nucleotidase domain protein [Ignavibacteriae bacterium]|nr:MAG: 5'-Nucleotidase domain protein [Ignavibacteriota bacterium]